MRKWPALFLVLALLITGGYLLVFEWAVPKTAAFTRPGKWHVIPLRQPLATVHGYFGEPDTHDLLREEWIAGTHRKQYSLRIYYGADTTAIAYSIHYRYTGWLVTREYLVDTGSIR